MSIAHITFATPDVAAAAEFYSQTLGWQIVHHALNIECPAAWLQIGVDQQLHLLQIPEFRPSEFEGEFGRHLAVIVPLADFAGLQNRLRAHDAEIISPQRTTPFQRFFFRSPDGYIIEVVEKEGHVDESA